MNGSKKQPRTSEPSTPEIDLAQLKRLASFMADHDLEEVEYAHGDLHIRLRKAQTSSSATPDVSVSFPSAQRVDAPAGGSHRSAPAAPTSSGSAQTEERRHLIKSPIVGTFYAGPSPDAKPFVRVGDVIKAGQTVCIIEAMKLMNEIEADAAGEVIQVLVENGQPVEYGMPLFALRPTETKK